MKNWRCIFMIHKWKILGFAGSVLVVIEQCELCGAGLQVDQREGSFFPKLTLATPEEMDVYLVKRRLNQ